MLYLITKALISGVIKMLASEAAKRSPRGRTNLTMRIYSPKADASTVEPTARDEGPDSSSISSIETQRIQDCRAFGVRFWH